MTTSRAITFLAAVVATSTACKTSSPSPPIQHSAHRSSTTCRVADFAPAEDFLSEHEDVEVVLSLTMDDTHVYWTDHHYDQTHHHVRRRLKTGGSFETLAAGADAGWVGAIAVDDKHVYWISSHDGMRRRAKTGGPIEHFAPEQSGIHGLALDDTHVYWTIDNQISGLRRRAKAGGPIEDVALGELHPTTIAIDATHVYWNSITPGASPERAGLVRRRAKAGGAITELAGGQGLIESMAVDATHLYWSTDNFDVRRRAKAGGAIEEVATEKRIGGGGPEIALDDKNVYWSIRSAGVVRRRAKEGGAIEDIRTMEKGAGEVAVDAAGAVYWVNYRSPMRRLTCARQSAGR